MPLLYIGVANTEIILGLASASLLTVGYIANDVASYIGSVF